MIEFFQPYVDNWSSWWPQLALATWYTIVLTALSYLLALVLGLILAFGRLSKVRFKAFGPLKKSRFLASERLSKILSVSGLCRAYIELMRGIPALALLFLLYYGLESMGIRLDRFSAAVIGLGMNQGAYLSEVFRGGIEALHKGQREAALAVGMTPAKAYRHILMPQAVRIVLPPLLNMLIILLKDSSICSLISTPELMLRTKDLASMSFLPMHCYLLAGLIYFVMAFPLSRITRRVEIHMKRGMHGATA